MAELALCGGERAVGNHYEAGVDRPVVGGREIQQVVELMKRGELSTSPLVQEFEERFAAYVGAEYALCTCNGTTAIQEALFAVGVEPGDEVIVPSYTFWATAGPVAAIGAVPVFCDVEEDTFGLDPLEVEAKITEKTAALVVVHVWGNPANMDALCRLAADRGIAVIEDCAHAHGAEWNNEKVGVVGDVGCFSLQASKVLVAGEGGVLVTSDRDCYERAVALGHYERLSDLPVDSPYRKYHLTGLGYKHRIHPVGAAIAGIQLEELDERNEIRDGHAKRLEEALQELEFITPQRVLPRGKRIYSYHYVRYEEEKLKGVKLPVLLRALKAEGVRCGRCAYGWLHEAPAHTEEVPSNSGTVSQRAGKESLPVTEELRENTFMLAPRFEVREAEIVDRYIAAYHKIAEHAEELADYQMRHGTECEQNVSGRSIDWV